MGRNKIHNIPWFMDQWPTNRGGLADALKCCYLYRSDRQKCIQHINKNSEVSCVCFFSLIFEESISSYCSWLNCMPCSNLWDFWGDNSRVWAVYWEIRWININISTRQIRINTSSWQTHRQPSRYRLRDNPYFSSSHFSLPSDFLS